jgi:hypothetical protein
MNPEFGLKKGKTNIFEPAGLRLKKEKKKLAY